MGRLYKRGDVYYLDYRDNGRRVRRKVGPDRKVAVEVLKALEGDAVRRKVGLSRQEVVVVDFADEYLTVLKLDHAESTVKRYRAELDHFRNFLRSIRVTGFLLSGPSGLSPSKSILVNFISHLLMFSGSSYTS